MSKILLIIALFISTVAHTQNLSFGLKAYYPFNGNANDVSGYGNNAVFNNATLTTDKQGNPNSAYHFNGVDNYMLIPNSSSLNMGTQISLAAKVRPTGFYTGTCFNNAILFKGDGDYLPGEYYLRFADIEYGCISPSVDREQFRGYQARALDPIIELNKWYDVVWTNDGTNEKIYVNCVLRDSRPSSGSTFTTSYNLFLGKMNDAQYPYWLNGDLDEVRIYDRVLTQDEVNLYGGCSLLPVRVTDFKATIVDKKLVALTWNAFEESSVRNYVIERAAADGEYMPIKDVAAINNAGKNSYTFTDATAVPNILYNYRIRVVDVDGTKKYSDTRSVKIVNNYFYASVYPNPAKETVKLLVNNYSGVAAISITNTLGAIVSDQKMTILNGVPANIDIRKLPAGTYWISVQTAMDKTTEKIIKQ